MNRSYWIVFSFFVIFLMAGITRAQTCPPNIAAIKDSTKRCNEAKARKAKFPKNRNFTAAHVNACCKTGHSRSTAKRSTGSASRGPSFSKEEFEKYLAEKYDLKDSGGAITRAEAEDLFVSAVLILLGIGLGILIFGLFVRQYIKIIRKTDSQMLAVINALRRSLLTEEDLQRLSALPPEEKTAELAKILNTRKLLEDEHLKF